DLRPGELVQRRIGVRDGGLAHQRFQGNRLARQERGAPPEAGRERDLGVLLGGERLQDQLVEAAVERAAPVEQSFRDRELFGELFLIRLSDGGNVCGHLGIRRKQVGEDREKPIAVPGYAGIANLEVEYAEELSVRAG